MDCETHLPLLHERLYHSTFDMSGMKILWLCRPIIRMAVRKDSLVAFCTSTGGHLQCVIVYFIATPAVYSMSSL